MWPFKSNNNYEERPAPAITSPQLELGSAPLRLTSTRTNWTTESLDNDQKIWGHAYERLGMPAAVRLPILMLSSAFAGFCLGAAKGGPIMADRYRAENAHRMPNSQSGWFLYHKSKNYHTILGSMREGFKFGVALVGWAAIFGMTEEIIDRSRARLFSHRDDDGKISEQRDAVSTVMAGMTVSGLYSWRRGFDHFAAARMSKMALKYSLIYGLVQDIAASLRGSPPPYVRWIQKKLPRIRS